MLKILAVGNSFSQDATALLQLIDKELFVRNAYIGGCSLERHVDEYRSRAPVYEYQENGERCMPGLVELDYMLDAEKWDHVTVQQRSGLSGIADSYYPHLGELISHIREHTDARISFHRTWSYEAGSDHPDFAMYGCDRQVMWERIRDVTAEVADRADLPVIDAGGFIQLLREQPEFDVCRGGLSLNRDGFHLSYSYGRLAAALVWSEYFSRKTPELLTRSGLSHNMSVIRDTFKKFIENHENI